MNRTQKIIVSVVGIFIVLLALLGVTYGYFLTRVIGNTNETSIKITTADLKLEYGENSSVIVGINNAAPGYTVEKTFTATNSGDANVTGYKVVLDNVVNELSRTQDLVYTLTCKSVNASTGVESGTCNGVSNETLFPKRDVYTVVSNDIAVGIRHEYKLTVTYKEADVDQSIDMGKAYSAKLDIRDGNDKEVLAYEAYESYLASDNTFDVAEATLEVREALDAKRIDSKDVAVYRENGKDRIVIGSGAYAVMANVSGSETVDSIQIGDYVNYQAPADIVPDYTPNFNDDFKWRMLGVDDDGYLLLLSDVTERIVIKSMQGANGFENWTNIYNTAAAKYADGIIGIEARSINVDDVNKVTGYNPMNVGVRYSTADSIRYEYGLLREYMNEVTFKVTSEGIVAAGSNGAILTTPSVNKFYPVFNNTSLVMDDSSSTYTVTRNYYSYYPETLTTTSNPSATVGLTRDSIAWNMLFANTEGSFATNQEYALADHYIDAKNGEAQWGYRIVSGARVTGTHYWNSKTGQVVTFDYAGNAGHAYLRVVVKVAMPENTRFERVNVDASTGASTYNFVSTNTN